MPQDQFPAGPGSARSRPKSQREKGSKSAALVFSGITQQSMCMHGYLFRISEDNITKNGDGDTHLILNIYFKKLI